jgi:predicted transcriptional regulator
MRDMDKSASLRIRLNPELHKEFTTLCQELNVNGSAVIRQCIQAFVERHRNDKQTDLFAVRDKP